MNTIRSRELTKTAPAVSIKRGSALAVPALLLLLGATACGNGQLAATDLAGAEHVSPTATAAATRRAIAMARCETEGEQTSHGAATFICTGNAHGQLVWLEASAAEALKDKRAADVAAKAAAKAAAEKTAAKAAAQKAAKRAARQAAAKKTAEAAAAAQAAKRAAEAKAAQEAAAAPAAADEVAQQALAAPPAAAPSNCAPNYSGACVPIASDVDCAGGSGNGPAYVQGPVTVTGSDIYGLDSNKDGVGCEG